MTSSASSTTATTSSPSPSCASAAALEATSASAIASSSRWLTAAAPGSARAGRRAAACSAPSRRPARSSERRTPVAFCSAKLTSSTCSGESANVTGTTWPGSSFCCSLQRLAALQADLADLDDPGGGDDDARLRGACARSPGTWRRCRRACPGRSCRPRRSRRRRGSRPPARPGARSGGATSMPSWSSECAVRSEPATSPMASAGSAIAVAGAHRLGISTVVIMSSVTAWFALTGLASARSWTLGSTSSRTSATYPATSTKTPEQAEGRDGDEQQATALTRVHGAHGLQCLPGVPGEGPGQS